VGHGRLRIYLGAAPGVGKTYAMLGEAHRRLARGTDVVVAFVETHNRPQTAQMLSGLEVVPRRSVEHRGGRFEEMDVDAVLARRPQVALVDELAHTNVPGSRHTKRWQDVQDLLAAGIDVVSTVNVQHLESLNDVVEAITGVRQRETVPDAVVRAANQIELVDMSPESLRRRLAHGNVYASEKVDAALANYFRVGNLTALRELALLWVADRVEEGLERYRADHGIEATWAARQRIVVALTGGPEGATLLRRGAGIAGRSAGRVLVAVHVVRGDGTVGANPDDIARLRQLTEDLSGTFHTVVGDDIAAAVLDFARSANGTQVVVGASRRGRISMALRPSTADQIVQESGDIDVHVVTHEKAGAVGRRAARRRTSEARPWLAWLLALAIPVGVTFALLPFRDSLALTTVVLAYLVGVVGSSLVGGLAPAIATSVVAGALANWFFTPPYGELTIAEPENAFALLVFVAVGAAVATIVDRSAARAQEAERRRAEANVLASLSAGVLRRRDGVRALLDQACETFGMAGAALFETPARPGSDVRVVEVSGATPPTSVESAAVAVDAGPGLVLALAGDPLPASDRRMLDAFATQAAAVLERDRLAASAADAARLRESDAVRTALLAALSHDLRTPLSGIKASIATLRADDLALVEEDREALLASAGDAADRLEVLLENLLDLSRLQAGAVRPVLSPTALDEVVHRALRGVPEATVVDETGDRSPLILTDAGLLERVVANLVENAVRHSPDGRPVRIDAAAAGDRLELRVVDCGPGVSEEGKARMFEAFQRLGDAPAGSGVGLGLAVARGLSDAVGATIEAEDTPGGGLTMVVSIPLAGPADVPTTQEEEPPR
jgi:two-component system sensor histidine kinase KdpD